MCVCVWFGLDWIGLALQGSAALCVCLSLSLARKGLREAEQQATHGCVDVRSQQKKQNNTRSEARGERID